MVPEPRIRRIVKPLVFVLCLIPLAWLVWRGLSGGLGANPIEAINRFLGDWAMRFLLVTLAVTPLLRLFGWSVLMRFRRISFPVPVMCMRALAPLCVLSLGIC